MKLDNVKPLSCNHENTKLYSMLKQAMENNEHLRRELADCQLHLVNAAETIFKLTAELEERNAR